MEDPQDSNLMDKLFKILKVVEHWQGLLGFEELCENLTKMCIVATLKSMKKVYKVFYFKFKSCAGVAAHRLCSRDIYYGHLVNPPPLL